MRATFPATVILMGLALSACANNQLGVMTPKIADAAVAAGDAAMAQGADAEAASMYGKAWQTSPSPSLAVRWGKALRLSGDPKAATLAMQEAARRYPSDSSVQAELGRAAMAGGFRPEAAEAFGKAASLPGAGWDVFMAQGAFQASNGREAEAEASFARAGAAAQSNRDRYSAQANLALLRASRGDMAGGIMDLELVAAHPEAAPKVHADLALLLGLNGDLSGFRTNIQQAMLPPDEVASVSNWISGQEVPRRRGVQLPQRR